MRGQLIGNRFALAGQLQSTAKSVVYQGSDRNLDLPVLVNRFSPQVCSVIPGYSEQFAREAKIASRLRHRNICRVLDYGETQLGGRRKPIRLRLHGISGRWKLGGTAGDE